jgi:Fatty acid desaturase
MGMNNSEAHADRRLTFNRDNGFYSELRRRVAEYFEQTGRRQRDCPEMYLKTAIILLAFIGLYVALVFVAVTWWQALGLSLLLGLAMAAIGFNIEHDGGHQAYSNHQWINRLMAMTMDLLGASSYVWHWKHDVTHHTYVNITAMTSTLSWDLLAGSRHIKSISKLHRWQHLYLWPLYGLNVIKWQLTTTSVTSSWVGLVKRECRVQDVWVGCNSSELRRCFSLWLL